MVDAPTISSIRLPRLLVAWMVDGQSDWLARLARVVPRRARQRH